MGNHWRVLNLLRSSEDHFRPVLHVVWKETHEQAEMEAGDQMLEHYGFQTLDDSGTGQNGARVDERSEQSRIMLRR